MKPTYTYYKIQTLLEDKDRFEEYCLMNEIVCDFTSSSITTTDYSKSFFVNVSRFIIYATEEMILLLKLSFDLVEVRLMQYAEHDPYDPYLAP